MASFSVIISTLNCGPRLDQALQSVVNQDFGGQYEIIVIDGGSNDCTLDVISKYRDSIAYFVSEPDFGIYDAWNKGIEASCFDWILFLGSDDALSPLALHTYDSYLRNCSSSTDYVSGKVFLREPSGKGRVIGRPWIWNEFKHFMKVAHVSSIHSRKLFQRYGFFSLNYSVCADYEFLLRPGNSLCTGFIDEVLAIMSSGGVSQSSIKPLLQTRRIKYCFSHVSGLSIEYDFFLGLLIWMGVCLRQKVVGFFS